MPSPLGLTSSGARALSFTYHTKFVEKLYHLQRRGRYAYACAYGYVTPVHTYLSYVYVKV